MLHVSWKMLVVVKLLLNVAFILLKYSKVASLIVLHQGRERLQKEKLLKKEFNK